MPRPSPIEPLERADFRLSKRHKQILKQLGGVKWLRAMLDKYAPLPKKYYTKD